MKIKQKKTAKTIIALSFIISFWSVSQTASANECLREIKQIKNPMLQKLLLAIGKQESRFSPYVVRLGKESHWAKSKAEAKRLVESFTGKLSDVDVGCMQINLHYHKEAISLDDMLTPAKNVRFALSLLARNYKEYGNWTHAIAHYNAGNCEKQAQYVCAIGKKLAHLYGLPDKECPAYNKPKSCTR
ncbi:putative Transglycosylase, SLT domain protein [Candidatus Terasakiella magnetica]|uniref:Putative Transglycosylase, SLT domain protein n=1 Tax=Candidatus Terasakiella magnetica TaxID=1867952 RepID=A0A1C3RLH5_9PROT|nr:transglycosylase SLT domain-containing protein [Candidatus Terasakiella magnetica]SCA58101.1 putative Transglycosylase, SLT domain protein [Candidatus Terasakiella magnetica]